MTAPTTVALLAENLARRIIEDAGVDPARLAQSTVDAAAFYARSEAEVFLSPYLEAAREVAPVAVDTTDAPNVIDLMARLEDQVGAVRFAPDGRGYRYAPGEAK